MTTEITLEQMVSVIRMPCQLVGNTSRVVCEPRSIDVGRQGSVAYCSAQPEAALRRINDSEASVIIGPLDVDLHHLATHNKTCILCRRPRLAFIRIMKQFFSESRIEGIHATAVIHDEATLGEHVYVGPFTYIGKAYVGSNTVIDGHSHIYDKVWIGEDCTIQAGAVIGSRGFGMERNEYGEFEDFPHIGGVVIGDGVVVGAGVTIARGTIENTVIGRGSRIDALSEISHNVQIGAHCGMCASCVVSGSSIVNESTWIAAGSLVREGLRIGSRSVLGLGSVVVNDVRKGVVVYGVPAREKGR